MTMINREPAATGLFLADRTDAALQHQQRVIIGSGNPVETTVTISAKSLLEFAIRSVPLSPTRVDLVLVSSPMRSISGTCSLLKFRVLCVSLPVPNGAAGSHRCFPPPVPSVKIVARTAAPARPAPSRGAPLLGDVLASRP